MPEQNLLKLKEEFSIDWLEYHATFNADMLAAVEIDTGREFTYRQFNDRLKCLATGLRRDFGVRHGDRIAFLGHNSTDVFEILFAGWEIGAALMPLNWRLSPHELASIIAHGEPTVIIHDEEFEALIADIDLPKLARSDDLQNSDYERLIASHEEIKRRNLLTIDDLSTLLYTSGTTGKPKGVMGTFRMMRDTIIHAALHGELSASSRALTCAPFFHSAGLYGFSMPIFHYGGTLYVLRKWDPEHYLRLMTDRDLRITHTIGVPVQYAMMAQLPSFASATFPHLRVAGVGAAPVSISLLETWAEKGVHLAQSYGLTEAFSVAILPPYQARDRIGSAGHRMMHTRLRIADAHGNRLEPGNVGEIQIMGPAVTPGYWKAPEETTEAFIDGWFKTGDIGRLETDGTIYIVDRIKDMYISGGENVYPAEVENELCRMNAVAAAAVVGVDDAKWGQVGLAVVTLKGGAIASEEDILGFCGERLAKYKVPRYLKIVDELPRSPQGKLLKNEVKRLYNPNPQASDAKP